MVCVSCAGHPPSYQFPELQLNEQVKAYPCTLRRPIFCSMLFYRLADYFGQFYFSIYTLPLLPSHLHCPAMFMIRYSSNAVQKSRYR